MRKSFWSGEDTHMTAFSSIYTSLTGLFSFTRALNTVSDNVANLNTPGFKSNDVLFRDLGLSDTSVGDGVISREPIASGNGVELRGTVRRFAQGDFQGTSSATDLAIDGNGFFVVRQDQTQRYTRAGQFTFNTDGYLVDAATGARTQALANGNQLSDFRVLPTQTRPPVPTSLVTFTSNLSSTPPNTPNPTPFSVGNIQVVDAAGNTRTLTANFTNNSAVTPGSWLVTIDEQNVQIASGEIRFQGTGSPAVGFN
ncbi:MAG: flagellar hook-basal body complex protein, partial [Nevskia sp.]|nr:flagellar hook-basal body complex protein [Nevskia sp.]